MTWEWERVGRREWLVRTPRQQVENAERERRERWLFEQMRNTTSPQLAGAMQSWPSQIMGPFHGGLISPNPLFRR